MPDIATSRILIMATDGFEESELFGPRAILKERLVKQFDFLDKHFAKAKFLAGSGFTVADAYAFTVLGWTKSARVAIDLSRWSNLKAYAERVGARPKVQEALKAEGLTG